MSEAYKDKFDYLGNSIIQTIVGGGWTDWETISPTPQACKREVFEEGTTTPGIPPWIKSPNDVLSAIPIIGTEAIKKVYAKFRHSLDLRIVNHLKNGEPAVILASVKVDLRDYIKALVAYDIPVADILKILRDETGIDKQAFNLSKEYIKTHYHEMGKAHVSNVDDDIHVDNYPTNPTDADIKRIASDMDEVIEPSDPF